MTVTHVNQLLMLGGDEFILQAYRSILNREPEPDGARFYRARLDEGVDKARILYEIAASVEGGWYQRDLPGLQLLMHLYRPRSGRLGKWLQRVAIMMNSQARIEHVIDRHVLVLAGTVRSGGEDMQSSLAERHQALATELSRVRVQLDGIVQRQEAATEAAARRDAAVDEKFATLEAELARNQARIEHLLGNLQARLNPMNTMSPRAGDLAPPAALRPAPGAEDLDSPAAEQPRLSAAGGSAAFLSQFACAVATSREARLFLAHASS